MEKHEDKFVKKLYKKVGKTIQSYEMINSGDNILAGVSGGKDSFVMLECLENRKRYLPFDFNVVAVHVHVNNVGYESNLKFLKKFCSNLNIHLHIIEYTVENMHKDGKNPCFVCSWHRRKKIFDLAKNLNCNKIAFGHHLEDALETLFMNMMFHGSISSLPQKFELFDGRVELIRPMLNTYEEDIERFAEIRSYPDQIKTCPYEDKTKRIAIRQIINSMHNQYNKSKLNIFRSMDNIYPGYLPKKRS